MKNEKDYTLNRDEGNKERNEKDDKKYEKKRNDENKEL